MLPVKHSWILLPAAKAEVPFGSWDMALLKMPVTRATAESGASAVDKTKAPGSAGSTRQMICHCGREYLQGANMGFVLGALQGPAGVHTWY